MEKLAELFESEKAFTCLKEIQEEHVIAGSSVTFALSDLLRKEDIGDVDIFVLKNSSFQTVEKIISKYFHINSYSVVDNEYEIVLNKNENEISVVTLNIDDQINFQIIITDFLDAQQVIDNFDFDYISVAIHKNKYHGKISSEKKVLFCNTKDIYKHRFIKTLKKGVKIQFWKTQNITIKHKEILSIENYQFVPLKKREEKCFLDLTKLRIVDIEKEGELICRSEYMIYKAYFVLSDGNNTFSTDELVANVDETFYRAKHLQYKELSIGHIKPYIEFINGESCIRYFVVKEVDDEMKEVIPFTVPKLDKRFNIEKEDVERFCLNKLKSDSKIVRSAWQMFYNSFLKGEKLEKCARNALGTYFYDVAKSKGYSYYPFNLEGEMIIPDHVNILDLRSIDFYVK